MPDWVVWVIIGVVAAGLLAALIVWLIKFFRKTPQERKEIVINFLIGLVTMAEEEFKDEHGKGAEKLKMVEEAFNRVAPWALKLMLKFSGAKDLRELIEMALAQAKKTWGLGK